MYDVHLGLIGKHAVDFLLVIIELFSLDVTAEEPSVKCMDCEIMCNQMPDAMTFFTCQLMHFLRINNGL